MTFHIVHRVIASIAIRIDYHLGRPFISLDMNTFILFWSLKPEISGSNPDHRSKQWNNPFNSKTSSDEY